MDALFEELLRLGDQVSKNNLAKNMSEQGVAIWAKRKKRYNEDNHQHLCDLSLKHNIGVYYKPSIQLCNEVKR